MRIRFLTVWLTLVALASGSPAWARQHIADASVQQQAIVQKDQRDAAARQTVVTVLHRPDVQALADRMDVDLTRAEAAVNTLPSSELNDLANRLLNVDPDLAGGNMTVTISLTTLLLVIIIIILIAD